MSRAENAGSFDVPWHRTMWWAATQLQHQQPPSRSWEKRKELVISLIIISCPNLDLSLVCEWFSQKNNNEAQSGRRSNGFHTTTPVFAPCRRYHYGQDHRLKKSLFFCLFLRKSYFPTCLGKYQLRWRLWKVFGGFEDFWKFFSTFYFSQFSMVNKF